MKEVRIVGLGVGTMGLMPEAEHDISKAQVLVGGQRLLERFKGHPAVKIPVRGPLHRVIEKVKREVEEEKDVVILADGDPGFYGIGRIIVDTLGMDHVIIHPHITTMQAAAARIKVPWHDIRTVSLHGRKDIQPLFSALAKADRVAVFTGPLFHPARIASDLILRGIDAFKMYVFEDLGLGSERIRYLELEEAKKESFSDLNFIILNRIRSPGINLSLGLDDNLFLHQKGLITKKEIRAAGLSALEIRPDQTVWDLGSGCGSMAVEASFLAHEGHVVAVEKDAARVRMIKENIRRTGAYAVEVIHGVIPGALRSLPDPDCIFIGGGMGKDMGVLEEAVKRIVPGGRLVLHLVLMGSLLKATGYFKSIGWPFSITQVQISRSKELAGDVRLNAINPVFILSTKRPCD